MKFLRNIAVKAASSVLRSLTVRESDGWLSAGMASDAGEHVNERVALSLSAVWACVNLLCGTQASLPAEVFRRDGNGRRQLDRGHRLYRILHDSPNYDQTAVDFWEFMTASIELHGNAYARIGRVGDAVASLTPIMPETMRVRRLANGGLGYTWNEDGKGFSGSEADILHIRGFGGHPLGGMSTLQFARNSIGLARAVDRAAATTFKNGLRPSGVLTFEKFLTAEQRAITHSKLIEQFAGAENSGKPLVLEGGTKWDQLTISPEDAQMLESRSFSIEDICRFFGTPPFLIGHTVNVSGWGTGLEQQTLGFQKFTLRRRLRRIEQALEKQLLTPADRALGVSIEFNLEGLLRGDSNGRANFYRTMTQIGAMTINEVRALENMPAVDGGDTPRVQMQNVPITEADQEAIQRLIAQQNGATP